MLDHTRSPLGVGWVRTGTAVAAAAGTAPIGPFAPAFTVAAAAA